MDCNNHNLSVSKSHCIYDTSLDAISITSTLLRLI